MVTEKERPKRFYAEGILSFVTVCDVATFEPVDYQRTKWKPGQRSFNPSTYTKLSCFLPWIVQQYGMEYKASGQAERECIEGQEDPRDGEKTCKITRSQLMEPLGEVECIFPFYYGGKR
jgi:hypothetical protein